MPNRERTVSTASRATRDGENQSKEPLHRSEGTLATVRNRLRRRGRDHGHAPRRRGPSCRWRTQPRRRPVCLPSGPVPGLPALKTCDTHFYVPTVRAAGGVRCRPIPLSPPPVATIPLVSHVVAGCGPTPRTEADRWSSPSDLFPERSRPDEPVVTAPRTRR